MSSILAALFNTSFFKYMSGRSFVKKLQDLLVLITLMTWCAVTYIGVSNFKEISGALGLGINHSDQIKTIVVMDHKIDQELRRIMAVDESDRVMLSRFHDGHTDVQGAHFYFATATNEVVQPGVAYVAPYRKDVLLSMINKWTQEFVNNRCVYITDITALDQYYEYFRQAGVRSSVQCPVLNIDGEVIAYVAEEFTTKTLPIEKLTEMTNNVSTSAGKIGALLSLGLRAEDVTDVKISTQKHL
jgi:hypothetical protein